MGIHSVSLRCRGKRRGAKCQYSQPPLLSPKHLTLECQVLIDVLIQFHSRYWEGDSNGINGTGHIKTDETFKFVFC